MLLLNDLIIVARDLQQKPTFFVAAIVQKTDTHWWAIALKMRIREKITAHKKATMFNYHAVIKCFIITVGGN